MTHFRKHSKVLMALVCILTLVLQLSFAVPSMAATTELDVIFVLDDSGSMKSTDPEKLSITAISKFADAAAVVTTVDVQYGAAIYGDAVKTPQLGLGATAEEVKTFVDENAERNQIHTNAAAGIKWATDELSANGRNNSTKIIVLIGDGVNDQDDGRTQAETKAAEEKSEQDKEAAIATAKSKGIKVYAIAVNESNDPNFKKYFEDIANQTGGVCHEPKNFDELQSAVDDIFKTVTGGSGGGNIPPVFTEPGVPVSQTITVEKGVYQMIIRCDYTEPLKIWLTDFSGNQYDDQTSDPTFKYLDDTTNKYIQLSVTEPEEGEWTITYLSDAEQTIETDFITFKDMVVRLKATSSEDVIEGKGARYRADVTANGEAITDEARLTGFAPKLAVVKLDKDGNRGSAEYTAMTVVDGQLEATPEFKKVGNYVVYVELKGDTSTITSNELTLEVLPDPNKLPAWVYILIGLGVVLLIIGAVFAFVAMRNSPDYINSELGVKITAKTPSQETMIFQNNVFNCAAAFGKQNTLSDVIRAYMNWYRSIGSGELTEMTINQYLNSNLTEVTDKIKFSGTKSGKTVLMVPKGLNIEVDGNPVKADKKIEFTSSEKEVEFVIGNNGYSYIIELMFRR